MKTFSPRVAFTAGAVIWSSAVILSFHGLVKFAHRIGLHGGLEYAFPICFDAAAALFGYLVFAQHQYEVEDPAARRILWTLIGASAAVNVLEAMLEGHGALAAAHAVPPLLAGVFEKWGLPAATAVLNSPDYQKAAAELADARAKAERQAQGLGANGKPTKAGLIQLAVAHVGRDTDAVISWVAKNHDTSLSKGHVTQTLNKLPAEVEPRGRRFGTRLLSRAA